MPWIDVRPTQDQVDRIMLENLTRADRPCHDCRAAPGRKHTPGCDTARCLVCGGQRLSCGCPEDKGYGDVWTGLWPGTIACYEYGLVCYWEGDIPSKGLEAALRFSLNAEADMRLSGAKVKKMFSFRDFVIKYGVKQKYLNSIYGKERGK